MNRTNVEWAISHWQRGEANMDNTVSKWTAHTLILFFVCISHASAQGHDAPVILNNDLVGNYEIAFSSLCSDDCRLKESANSGASWSTIYNGNDQSPNYLVSNKPPGTYQYRVQDLEYDYEEQETIVTWSDISSVVVNAGPLPEYPALSEQENYSYVARYGDIDGNGTLDFFVDRTDASYTENGAVVDALYVQQVNGRFFHIEATAAQLSTAHGWPVVPSAVDLADLNIDGYLDVLVRDLGTVIPGAADYAVYAPAAIFESTPRGRLALDSNLDAFLDEFSQWVDDRQYYDNGAIWTPGESYWEEETDCDLEWTWQGWQWVCTTYWTWVEEPPYWSYEHFHQGGLGLAREIQKILDGAVGASMPAVKAKLEQILGVTIGGWDFGIPFPGGIDGEITIFGTLMMAIISTRNEKTNETPACISQNPAYYQDRINRYLEPNDIQSDMDVHMSASLFNVIDSIYWQPNKPRYNYVSILGPLVGFGFFDAKHAATAYLLGNNDLAFELEEFWESIQACQSGEILEDIYGIAQLVEQLICNQ